MPVTDCQDLNCLELEKLTSRSIAAIRLLSALQTLQTSSQTNSTDSQPFCVLHVNRCRQSFGQFAPVLEYERINKMSEGEAHKAYRQSCR